ncbi:MAG: capsule assembly Wzi family protein [Acidobacteriota bacterium]
MKILLSGFCALSLWAASGLSLFAQNAPARAVASAGFPIDLSDTTAAAEVDETWNAGSPYVPVDWWVYPALERLYALGYIDTAYLGLRPWTRMSIVHMLLLSAPQIEEATGDREARGIFVALMREFQPDLDRAEAAPQLHLEPESVYTLMRGISGTPLRDSYHLGQTLVNDYGRPYQHGFNEYSGFSAFATAGRFSLYWRGEFQHAPSAAGYSPALAAYLSNTLDLVPYSASTPQDTDPAGPISVANDMRVLEANLSVHLLGHEVSFGKDDHWLGPDKGASMLWGNNAEDIYDFEINRVEPLYIPGLSRLTGPFRYDFFVGSLKGHTYPNSPWVHMEKISFKPTHNLEFGFSRMDIWGGKGHAPITLHTFLHSFFSFQNVSYAEKESRNDPGDRLGNFDFTYRLPFLRKWVTIYTDSIVHDDVSPISAPPRSGLHSGVYLARFPHFENLSLRAEGGSTDTPIASTQTGQFLYWETIQRQGPTNKGFLVGDWMGRQGKGGQAWLTYHLSPREEVGLEYRRAQAAPGFIPGGTTQNDYVLHARKRVLSNIELKGFLQFESWKAPIYLPGAQRDTTAAFQVTWFPGEPAPAR